MNPKWHPVALPIDCAPFGEHPFQPYLIKGHALVVAGGPSALFLITATHVPEFALTIQARVRISGFAVHGSMLYVQDGPVLSRWNIVDLQCSAAINVVVPTQRYSRGTQEPDWDGIEKPDERAPNREGQKENETPGSAAQSGVVAHARGGGKAIDHAGRNPHRRRNNATGTTRRRPAAARGTGLRRSA